MTFDLSAVVVAAGRSSRFQKSLNSDQSKQFIEWSGRPLFVHTLEALSFLSFSEIALVIRPEEEAAVHKALERHTSKAALKIVFGGERRQDSVRNGLESLTPTRRVFIHDGARPFLSARLLHELNEKSKSTEALIPVLPVFETLKEVDPQGVVVKTMDRNRFVRVQTPQAFKFNLILEAHQKLKTLPMEFTDDAAMLEHLGISVHTCAGDPENIKVTIADDLRLKNIHVG
jgi:2-C-methyl-D-erythritol 4-phosphate cytidylyltransferase